MAGQALTLMAVHAHPDDEASSTGGVLALYSAQGVRTVLVTCTDGGCGDGAGGVKPGDPAHERSAVVAVRRLELEASCSILGISDLEVLGYRDSGMMGWPTNDEPGSFWTTPVEAAASKLVALMERYRPQVVVTYDANGFYGHPDHIQTHRVTMAAVAECGIPAKVYFPTIPRSRLGEFVERVRQAGVEIPDLGATADAGGPEGGGDGGPAGPDFGATDEEIAAWIDVSSVVDAKFDALAAHASQADNTFFLGLGRKLFAEVMAQEVFLKAIDDTGSPVPEHDLFAGLR